MSDQRRWTVAEWMTSIPLCIPPSMSVRSAFAKMRIGHFRHLLVVKEGELVGMVTDRDLLVPPVDQPVLLEPRHQLIERRAGAANPIRGQCLAQASARLRLGLQHAQDEELQVRQQRQGGFLHNATLSTIGLDAVTGPKVRVECAA